jgi:multidrug efflux pump subunit AcrA (membrane-fusion protein)
MVVVDNRTAPAAQPAARLASAPFSSYIFGPGIVEASTENIAVGTSISGIVTAVYAKWGDRVKRGAPLFKIDTRDLEAQLPAAAAKVKEMEAQLSSANAKISEARENLGRSGNRLKVGEELEIGVSISAQELANRQFDVGVAKAGLASAQGQVEQINAQIESANAQVMQLRNEMELRTVRAPISGRVLQMKTRLGEYAQSGAVSTPLMLLGDDTRLHVRVDIDENDAWKFQPCAPAAASVRGNPELKAPLQYVRTEPAVIPKVLLTGDTTQRTDSRVLQVVYSFDPAALPLYVGQVTDVFIEALPSATNARPQDPAKPCSDSAAQKPQNSGRRKP